MFSFAINPALLTNGYELLNLNSILYNCSLIYNGCITIRGVVNEKQPKKLSIGLLIALVGFPQISETIYTPALPHVASGLQASAYLVEATLAIYFIGFALGVLLWGAISDWIGRRNAMLMGIIVYGIGTVGCATVENVEALLAWRFLQAFGASVGSVITQTMLRDSFDGTERIKLFAIMSGALAFSPAIGPLLGGVISEFLGWRANFWGVNIAIDNFRDLVLFIIAGDTS